MALVRPFALLLLGFCGLVHAQFAEMSKRDDQSLEMLRRTIGPDASIRQRGDALIDSVASGHLRSAQWLIDTGADCDYANHDGITPLMALMFSGPTEDNDDAALDALAQQGARIVPWREGDAFAKLDSQLLVVLTSCTKQLQARNSKGAAAIHLAAIKGRFDRVHVLVKAGADINLALPDGDRVLFMAPASQYQQLAAEGADVRLADLEGRTLLHHIAQSLYGDRLIDSLKKAVAIGARDRKDARGLYAADLINGFAEQWMGLRLRDNAGVEKQLAQAKSILRSARDR